MHVLPRYRAKCTDTRHHFIASLDLFFFLSLFYYIILQELYLTEVTILRLRQAR